MEKTDYLIIGNSAAGINAAEAIRSRDDQGRVVVVTEEAFLNYSKPLITYYLGGTIPMEQINYRQNDFYSRLNIDLKLNTKIVDLDTSNKTATTAGGNRIGFKKCLIASGGCPIIPPIDTTKARKLDQELIAETENIFTLTTLEDAHRLKHYLERSAVDRVTILGAGLIGLKAAEALLSLGLEIDLIELSDRILSATLDQQASSILEKRISELGSKIYTGRTIKKIHITSNRASSITLTDGRDMECQVLVVAVGVRPNTSFIKQNSLDSGQGIRVDRYMETSVPQIFAAGDVVQSWDVLADEDKNIAIWPLAVLQGKTAGLNMAGDRFKYDGGFFMNSVEIMGIPSISMGLTQLSLDNGNQVEVLKQLRPEENYYKKIIIRQNRVAGVILVGNIDRAGIYAGLIKNGIEVQNIKDNLLREDFGLIQLPSDYQKHLVVGEGIEV